MNTGLEKILHWNLSAVDQIISKLKDKVLLAIGNPQIVNQFKLYGNGYIKGEMHFAAIQIAEIVKRNRAMIYLISHAGETEAMARALNKTLTANTKTKPRKSLEMPCGGSVDDRIFISFERLSRCIQDAIQLGTILEETPDELKMRVAKCFPKTRQVTKTPALKRRKLKESNSDDEMISKVSTGITDDEMWQVILDDYRATTLPDKIFKRGPDDRTMFYDVTTEETSERYTWEVEQEITEDFVREVRAGTQDAARDHGVVDFMWIAVVDSHTDDCCLIRDGKSSSEIENQIEDGTIDGDECDAIVAPAHFNCRCDSAPMDADLPEAEPIDYGGFDDWLASKAGE